MHMPAEHANGQRSSTHVAPGLIRPEKVPEGTKQPNESLQANLIFLVYLDAHEMRIQLCTCPFREMHPIGFSSRRTV